MFTHMLVALLLIASALGQSTVGTPPATQVTHYPAVIRAEVPLYPPIAWAAHFTGTVEIQVTLERGAVVDAQVKSVVLDPSGRVVLNEEGKKRVGLYLSNPSVANVKTWQFESEEDRTTFLVTYVYKIEGEETPLPENPKVELDLPRLVTVTARPVKPICLDSGCGGNAR
jgi:hypothetical protein